MLILSSSWPGDPSGPSYAQLSSTSVFAVAVVAVADDNSRFGADLTGLNGASERVNVSENMSNKCVKTKGS